MRATVLPSSTRVGRGERLLHQGGHGDCVRGKSVCRLEGLTICSLLRPLEYDARQKEARQRATSLSQKTGVSSISSLEDAIAGELQNLSSDYEARKLTIKLQDLRCQIQLHGVKVSRQIDLALELPQPSDLLDLRPKPTHRPSHHSRAMPPFHCLLHPPFQLLSSERRRTRLPRRQWAEDVVRTPHSLPNPAPEPAAVISLRRRSGHLPCPMSWTAWIQIVSCQTAVVRLVSRVRQREGTSTETHICPRIYEKTPRRAHLKLVLRRGHRHLRRLPAWSTVQWHR